jgi:hypothetical protein
LTRADFAAEPTRYALAHWDALARYKEDGRIEIDNNAAERSLRGAWHRLCRQGSRATKCPGRERRSEGRRRAEERDDTPALPSVTPRR